MTTFTPQQLTTFAQVLSFSGATNGLVNLVQAQGLSTIAILIDYYVVYLLALLSLRVWDDGDPGANLVFYLDPEAPALSSELDTLRPGPRDSGSPARSWRRTSMTAPSPSIAMRSATVMTRSCSACSSMTDMACSTFSFSSRRSCVRASTISSSSSSVIFPAASAPTPSNTSWMVTSRPRKRHGEPRADARYPREERAHRGRERVPDRESLLERQHGDEMRRPDGGAAADGDEREPAAPLLRFARAVRDDEGGGGSEQADGRRDQDEAVVMLDDQTVVNAPHAAWSVVLPVCRDARQTRDRKRPGSRLRQDN